MSTANATRTLAARRAFAAKFASTAAKTEYFAALARKSVAARRARVWLSPDEAARLRALIGEIGTLLDAATRRGARGDGGER
ncbi:MAG TPA: hypothetical protein VFB73_04765 [Chloroflexota bacterium]|nr:hypothetical protein [Chloroflexota bacterium]